MFIYLIDTSGQWLKDDLAKHDAHAAGSTGHMVSETVIHTCHYIIGQESWITYVSGVRGMVWAGRLVLGVWTESRLMRYSWNPNDREKTGMAEIRLLLCVEITILAFMWNLF